MIVGLIFAAGGGANLTLGGVYLFDWVLEGITSANLGYLLDSLIFINLFWGLINLLPVYPLDGGKVSRELLLTANPGRGIEWSLQLSMVAAIAMAIYALFAFDQAIFVVLLFGYLAFASYQTLAAYRNFGGFGGGTYGDDDNRGRGW